MPGTHYQRSRPRRQLNLSRQAFPASELHESAAKQEAAAKLELARKAAGHSRLPVCQDCDWDTAEHVYAGRFLCAECYQLAAFGGN